MGSLNGFGTMYYGWRHHQDGTATATKWIAISWIPIIPLHREKLRVLTNFKKDNENIKVELGGLYLSLTDKYQILEKLPLSFNEVSITLVKTYIGIPLLLLGPLVLLFGLMWLLHKLGVSIEQDSPSYYAFMVVFLIGFVNFLWQSVRLIRKARGWQPNT